MSTVTASLWGFFHGLQTHLTEAELRRFQRREPRGGQQAAVQILLGLGAAEALVCVGQGCSVPLAC